MKAKSSALLRLRSPILVAILAYLSTALMGCAFLDTLDRVIRWFPTIGYPTTVTTSTTLPATAVTTTALAGTTVTTVVTTATSTTAMITTATSTTVTSTTATSTTATSTTTATAPATTSTTVTTTATSTTTTTATSTTTVTTTGTSTTTTTTPIPEATINGEFDTTVNDPQAFVDDPDVEAAMVETIANMTEVEEEQVEVEMEVVTAMASFLQVRRLGSGTVRVNYEIRVPEPGNGTAGGEQVRQKIVGVSKASLQVKIVGKIQARKASNGLVNPFTVAVARKTNPRVIHPWATRRTSTGTTTEISTTTTGTTTLLPALAKNQTADAHFLMTATFGPTRASLAEIGGLRSHEEWVLRQMALPVGSHRQYYRERIAPKMTAANHISGPRPSCSKGSRWRGIVFRAQDVGKAVIVGGGKIWLDGVHVSDIDPQYTGNAVPAPITCNNEVPSYWVSQGKDCPNWAAQYVVPQNCFRGIRQDWEDNKYCQQTCFDGGSGWPGDDCSVGWPNLYLVGYVCDVREGLGEWMRLSTSSACNGGFSAMLNPAIWFSSAAPGTSTTAAFQVMTPGTVILAETPSSCTFGDVVQTDTEAPGRFYVHESRMQLIANTLDTPATKGNFAGTLCPSAPRTFLNERAGCRVVAGSAGCVPVQMRRARFSLNGSSIRRLSSIARRQVFTLRGLRPAAGPCGRPSRWRLLDCLDCRTPTALAEADAAALRAALVGSARQGWLRDVEVACGGAPPGAVVDAGSGEGLFEHVHEDEYNVYDFTEVEEAANWTARGEELHFPEGADVSRWDTGVGRLAARSGLLGRLGADVRLEELRASFQVGKLFDLFSGGQAQGTYSVVCGSPGEVENKPVAGHHMPFHMSESYATSTPDTEYDGGPYQFMWAYNTQAKRNIMVNKAIYGEDQLRQRMAWALSQIITVATFDGPANMMTEMYVHFYDIFVRHAFGNYRDIMREMTYSPIMANWLTYINNKAVDVDGLFPDENYAREIMQVFSIGLWKLHRNGSRVKDQAGEDVRTYENWNILDFARVFTGLVEQAKRGNVEDNGRSNNLMDPMRMHAEWHDVFPKPNLDMGYLGDGYPLCNDLPQGSFLAAGAKFSFLGSSTNEGGVLVLSQGSPLFAKLCNASAAPCSFSTTVELGASLQCQGDECTAERVTVVQVADGFYEYVPPACVYPFFWDTGRVRRYEKGHQAWWDSERWTKCVEQTASKAAGAACCKGCTNVPNGWMVNNGYTCENINDHHSWLLPARCNTNDFWTQMKYCAKTCYEMGYGYPGYNCSTGDFAYDRVCAYDGERMSYPEAERRCASQGMEVCKDYHTYTGSTCGYFEDYLWTPETCAVSIIAHVDGRVSVDWDDLAAKNKFPVLWKDGFPAQNETGGCPSGCTPLGESCKCTATAAVYRAFDALPSRTDLLTKLRVGAWPPTTAPCIAGCGGEVEAYSATGAIDTATVFKYDGRFFKNVEHKVHLPSHEFRNPPTFTLKHWPNAKTANDEIEALIDHLFYHENTPQFLAYHLIQRFTSSNPSAKYIYDVQAAFRNGHFNGTRYSGAYGDLGAAVAAIVLHPEARQVGTVAGALREPMLKIIHFMRAMEYQTTNGREVQLRDLMDRVGQWPYSSVDVFNFFHPEYQPPGLPDGMVGPEFQIWTMPNILGYINGMTSTMYYGHGQCGGGIGWPQPGCGGGSFTFAESQAGNRDATIAELDLLLAGGHLGNHSAAVLAYEYDKAPAGSKLEAAQYASLVVPAFATLGDGRLPVSPAPAPAPTPAPPARSYRAVVMMYLSGGMDSFQMLVPTNCQLHDEYRSIRESIAFVPDQLLGISTTGQACSTFGVHPNMPNLRNLYNAGDAAFVSNIGSLIEPLTAKKFREDGRRCQGLFSHIDQVRAAHTLTCQTPSPIYKGAGGRLGDALANGPHGYKTESFSMAGRSTWTLGFQTDPKIVGRSGNIPLTHPNQIVSAIDNVTRVTYGNAFCEEYRRQLKDAIDVNNELGQTFASATLSTSFSTSSGLADQLKQVARLIAAKDSRKAERDIFFVHQGGFDHHSGVANGLRNLLPVVDQAINLFVTELKAQGNFDEVTLVMHSDFGRTLAPNSNAGTDHGWAGHTFVVGGSVNGGKVYNRYPQTLVPGHSMDVMHGRIIPEFPWENIMVPIAQWMGMEQNQTRGVFPNLDNFNVSEHILAQSAVFAN